MSSSPRPARALGTPPAPCVPTRGTLTPTLCLGWAAGMCCGTFWGCPGRIKCGLGVTGATWATGQRLGCAAATGRRPGEALGKGRAGSSSGARDSRSHHGSRCLGVWELNCLSVRPGAPPRPPGDGCRRVGPPGSCSQLCSCSWGEREEGGGAPRSSRHRALPRSGWGASPPRCHPQPGPRGSPGTGTCGS